MSTVFMILGIRRIGGIEHRPCRLDHGRAPLADAGWVHRLRDDALEEFTGYHIWWEHTTPPQR
jgi:hypothetical protein